MVIRQGDVFWAGLGSPRGSAPGYSHPVVVIQSDRFNRSLINSVVVCIVTTNLSLAAATGNVRLLKGEGGLPRSSVANVSQIATLDKSALSRKLGSLEPERIVEILAGVALVLERTS